MISKTVSANVLLLSSHLVWMQDLFILVWTSVRDYVVCLLSGGKHPFYQAFAAFYNKFYYI